jgi:class 3 adenylate cyclase/tetratricopeptide (TPR) repeat protein
LATASAARSQRLRVELEPFVSELARAWHRDAPELNARDVAGTLVFADISGFTRLTERLAVRGRIGAEEMSDHLDGVLSELLAAAYEHGGWLVKWGGDALLLMFDEADHARLACAAAVSMQSRMRRVGVLDASVGKVRLRMSVGIHTGSFSFHLLGHRHRELLITGDAATVTARLEALAEAGEILISPTTAELLPAACLGAAKGDGILLSRTPAVSIVQRRRPAPSLGVSGLIPELVLSHLVSGGGSGEHRQVTVAFLEFSGLAALGDAGGPEATSAALEQLVEVTQDACHRNGVSFHETDIAPDGGKIMLVAGAPRGLEDPAEAMLCTLRQILEDPGPLSLRAGVTAGRAFTGSVGPANRRSYSVKGDVVNLAARITGKAQPGQIWALPIVAESSRTRFELGDVPRFAVKGKVAPVLVRSIGRPLSRADTHADLPFIGRAEEMATLQSALDRARDGHGEHLDLIGAPGIGKTRLLAELRAAATDMTVLATAAEPYRASSPYALAGPLLLEALGADEVATADLPGWLESWCLERAPQLQAWLPLLRAPLGIVMTDSAQTSDLAPEFRADRIQALVADLLRAAMPGLSLIVVDDMQFADEASAALLRHVAQDVAGQPWLIVLAGRTGRIDEDTQQLASGSLVVGPLSAEEAFVFTCADTDDAPLAPHVTAAVVARGDGNPLFLRQLAATAHTTADISDLPDTIETVVAARIDQLPPAAREVLRAAAVVGMSIDRELLTTLLQESPARTTTMLEHLSEFLEADDSELRFRQAVIRDSAYEGLAFRRRAALHGRLAALLADHHGDDLDAIDAVLSLHLLEAGENDKALRAARSAADRAADSHANTEAAVLYRRAITAQARLTAAAPDVRAELLERLGDVEVRLGEYEPGDRSYSAAARLLRGDPLAVARLGLKRARSAGRQGAYNVALGRLRRVARALHGVGGNDAADLRVEMAMSTAFTQFRQGRLAAARANCLSVVEHGDERRSPEIVADALAILDLVELSLGIGASGLRAVEALRLHQRRGDLAGQARVRTQIGYRAYLDGRWNDAVGAYAQARELVERLGDLPNVAVANANIAEIRLDQGRLEEADAALREAIRVWRASGSENDVAFGRALLGRVLARQGKYDAADALLRQAKERFVEQGAKADVVDSDAYQAECLLLRGIPEQALVLAESSLVAAGRLSDQPILAPLLYRVIGASHDILGRTTEADVAFERALEAARRRDAAHEVAFTITAMAGRARREGRELDPALVTEVGVLQRRLGLVIDLTALEEAPTASVPVPPQRSGSGVAAVTS